MGLICLSFSHRNVPIALRERIYFDADSTANACARFIRGDGQSSRMLEFLLLSTCNRTEFYIFFQSDQELPELDCEIQDEVLAFVARARSITEEELKQFGRWMHGPEVAFHISRVACGLQSLVVGEPQILGQVGDAMRTAMALDSAGSVLTRLFQTAIRAGRRARTETDINLHSQNISTVAVNTAKRQFGSLEGKSVLVLGSGEMADLALTQLRKHGVTDIRIVNRTMDRAEELANRHGGQAFVFEQMAQLLPDADLLITSTGAPHTLIDQEMVQYSVGQRPERSLLIFDIAVPRDVDPAVSDLPNVFRYDIDDLRSSADQSQSLRQQQVPQVESLIQKEVDGYLEWLRSIGVESIIASWRKKADEIRAGELQRLKAILSHPNASLDEAVEKFSKSLVNKLMHSPTMELRQLHGTRGAVDYAEAIRQLFQLEATADGLTLVSPNFPGVQDSQEATR